MVPGPGTVSTGGMRRVPVAAIWMCARGALHSRRATWALLVVAIGLAAGASVAAVAGGYRTLHAVPHFVADARAADLYFISDCASPTECRSVVDRAAALPTVAVAGAAHMINAEFHTTDGRALTANGDPCFGGSDSSLWGVPVAFNGAATDPSSADQANLHYSWSFGDGSPSATGGPNVSHTYSTAGD
jgi:hypothetical protein